MLTLSDVRKEFGGITALDDVSFEVSDEEIVGVIGPNGAGKSTLFNTIAGVYEVDGGTISFNGHEMNDMATHERVGLGIGRTFQLVRAFEDMTVLDNVVTGAVFGGGHSMADGETTARDVLEFVGLEDEAEQPASSLTVSQKKRVELARSLACDPGLLLIDEIASGLTPSEIESLTDLIRETRDTFGITVLWIEHIMAAINSIVDRIIVLHKGRVIASGTPTEISNNEQVITAYLGAETA